MARSLEPSYLACVHHTKSWHKDACLNTDCRGQRCDTLNSCEKLCVQTGTRRCYFSVGIKVQVLVTSLTRLVCLSIRNMEVAWGHFQAGKEAAVQIQLPSPSSHFAFSSPHPLDPRLASPRQGLMFYFPVMSDCYRQTETSAMQAVHTLTFLYCWSGAEFQNQDTMP